DHPAGFDFSGMEIPLPRDLPNQPPDLPIPPDRPGEPDLGLDAPLDRQGVCNIDPTTLYVDAAQGSDVDGGGGPACPLQTITFALNQSLAQTMVKTIRILAPSSSNVQIYS